MFMTAIILWDSAVVFAWLMQLMHLIGSCSSICYSLVNVLVLLMAEQGICKHCTFHWGRPLGQHFIAALPALPAKSRIVSSAMHSTDRLELTTRHQLLMWAPRLANLDLHSKPTIRDWWKEFDRRRARTADNCASMVLRNVCLPSGAGCAVSCVDSAGWFGEKGLVPQVGHCQRLSGSQAKVQYIANHSWLN